jgi:S-DNA-T family DNA segregation ATPase FtsK/SpoIIIE
LIALCSAWPGVDATTLAARWPDAELVLLGSSTDAAARAAIMLGAGVEAGAAGPRIVVGDADAWAGNWSLAAQARGRAALVVHGGPSEFRALARESALPPLLDDPRAQCWEIPRDGEAVRRRWPSPDD